MCLPSTHLSKSPYTRDVVGNRARSDPPAKNPRDVSRRRIRDCLPPLSLKEHFTWFAPGPTDIVSLQRTRESWVVHGHGLTAVLLCLDTFPEGVD